MGRCTHKYKSGNYTLGSLTHKYKPGKHTSTHNTNSGSITERGHTLSKTHNSEGGGI